jgi:hypothetical protein
MRVLDYLHVALIVSGRLDTKNKPVVVTWLIDGTNLQCCTGRGRRDRQHVINEIAKIASNMIQGEVEIKGGITGATTPISNVVLVFDGHEDEAFEKIIQTPFFQTVITDGKGKRTNRADDYIVNCALPELQKRFEIETGSSSQKYVVHLVSADRDLRKRAAATRLMNGGSTVDPPKFWKKYLPNLQK